MLSFQVLLRKLVVEKKNWLEICMVHVNHASVTCVGVANACEWIMISKALHIDIWVTVNWYDFSVHKNKHLTLTLNLLAH